MALLFVVPTRWVQAQGDDYDFALPRSFLERLRTQKTLETTLEVLLTARTSSVHPPQKDCEMHLAGRLAASQTIAWDPEPVVVEPPNLCVNDAPTGDSWGEVFDTSVLNQLVSVTGFFRVFTEHASGKTTAANPNHAFEIHPATAIGSLDFHAMLPPPDSLVAITAKRPRAASSGARYRSATTRARSATSFGTKAVSAATSRFFRLPASPERGSGT